MNPTEVAEELRQAGSEELLRSATLARLAYTAPDGFPRVIPIGFYWNGEEVVFCTATTAPKVRALTAARHVAVTIDTDAAKALLLRGVATLETVDGVPDEFLEASKKAMGGMEMAEFETQVRSMYKQMVRIAVRPQWARFYDFQAGRVPQFLRRLAENA